MTTQTHPLDFFGHLVWLDGRPLLDTIESYRRRIFSDALDTFDADGRPTFNQVLAGRGKKNWKSADLILAGLHRFLGWESPSGNDSLLVANDEDQAADDLEIAKKLVDANPILSRELEVRAKELVRRDGRGRFRILPAQDVRGAHGKTYLFLGYDEIHAYKDYGLFEALAPDPSRTDALVWITTYDSIYNSPGYPLFDLKTTGKRGDDPRMYFTWYSGDYTTDPEAEALPPEERANPSMASWGNPDYLAQQRRRLPTHKFRRLHLNLPGMPDGTYLDAEAVLACIDEGVAQRKPQAGIDYVGFVDMSGGSNDDAVLGIAHHDEKRGAVLDLLAAQSGRPPFNPRQAVKKFARLLKRYHISAIRGDAYAGETFRKDFEDENISYWASGRTKHQLYEAIEPRLNAREVVLLDEPKLQEQLLGLVSRGTKIDHQSGEHDDWANAASGALILAAGEDTVDVDEFRAVHSDYSRMGIGPREAQELRDQHAEVHYQLDEFIHGGW